MSANVEALLAKLEKVKRTGRGSWLACCPAHEDRSPSLSIAERDDMVLLHCFAGCAALEVLNAVGMDFADVMPHKPDNSYPQIKRAFPAADVLEALAEEVQIVGVCAATMTRGDALSTEDSARLFAAISRIQEGRRLANG